MTRISDLQNENEELRRRLTEAEETILAIQAGGSMPSSQQDIASNHGVDNSIFVSHRSKQERLARLLRMCRNFGPSRIMGRTYGVCGADGRPIAIGC
jgi:RNA polymerase-binding transcription factor DksA